MKKIIISAAAVISVAAITSTAVFAVNKYSAQDLKNLSSSVLGKSEITDGQDVNGDGRVDVYDVIEMRKSFVGTGEFTEQIIDISEENVKYIGRNI
ncbi:MAG: hypothetical protein K2H19_01105, partial [Ruminococcus sp.]|nr:hypothetical protein [Ruminococcus sp.]